MGKFWPAGPITNNGRTYCPGCNLLAKKGDRHCRVCGQNIPTEKDAEEAIKDRQLKEAAKETEIDITRQILVWPGDKHSFEQFIGWRCSYIYMNIQRGEMRDRGISMDCDGRLLAKSGCTLVSKLIKEGLIGLVQAQPQEGYKKYGIPVKIKEVQPEGWPQPRPELKWWSLLPDLTTSCSELPSHKQLEDVVCKMAVVIRAWNKRKIEQEPATSCEIKQYYQCEKAVLECADLIGERNV